jgi:hypothetical protein
VRITHKLIHRSDENNSKLKNDMQAQQMHSCNIKKNHKWYDDILRQSNTKINLP